MTPAKMPASQDGPAMSVPSRRSARPGLGFMVAHNGTRLMGWPRPAQAPKAAS